MAYSHTQRVHDTLRQQIVTGALTPGAKLKVEDLKRSLNVGTAPIREALSLLTSDQLVERKDQRGFRVAEVSAKHFAEILKLRLLLEGQAVVESVSAGGSAWETRLRESHDALAGWDRRSASGFELHHKAFHMALIAAADAPTLLGLCNQLYDQNVRYRNLAARDTGYSSRDVSHEHDEIFAAALDRDAEYTATLLRAHYQRTGQYLLSMMSDV